MKKHKALALFSGGLDSLVSVLWMRKLGFEVIPIFFRSYFFSGDKAKSSAAAIGVDLQLIDIHQELLEVLKQPKYGFGKYKNPCIDCHSLMFREAGKRLTEFDADFLISGEVLGQRPMSQRLDAMNAVKNYSGYADLIVRPLSQRLLPDTLPVREGWVSKYDLLDIQGRGRRRQMELAKQFGITEYPTPGGGCFLTEKIYSLRLTDLMKYDQLSNSFVRFLEYGRHFRLTPDIKVIIGRRKEDNESLERLTTDEVKLRLHNIQGPLGVVCVQPDTVIEDNRDTLLKAASILLSFTGKAEESDEILIIYPGGQTEIVKVKKMNGEEIKQYWITEK